MKKITFLFVLMFSIVNSNAQIAAGSVAPNFTAVDINGVTHSLSDYLAAGKTVIMDVSATWCGPCWNFHNSKALEDIYESYGPGGSNEVVVLFIEGDAATTSADLNGTGTNTKGNWVANTPYPIIDGSNIGNLYQITYFPTLFRICPNGIVSEISTGSASTIRANINGNCLTAPATLVGVQNHVEALDNTNSFCAPSGIINAKIRNYGANTVTTATLKLKENGTVIETKPYTGTISRYTTRIIPFSTQTLNPTANYTVEVTNVNASPLFNPNLGTAEMGVTLAAPIDDTAVTIKVYTDNYPSEMSWNIKSSTGTIVASGGSYVGAGGNAGGGPDANTTKTSTATFTAGECYTVTLTDAFGDGWAIGNTPHGLQIFNAANVSLYNLTAGNFGTSLVKNNALRVTNPLATENVSLNEVKLYPNPSNGIFNLETLNPVTVTVIDVLGKIVYTTTKSETLTKIDLSGLEKGIYIARIVGEGINASEKLILK